MLNFHKKPTFEHLAKDDISGVQFGNLVLPDRYKSCWVIDGQHRLYGTVFTEQEYKVPLFFIGFDRVTAAQEANIFVEINAKQATVPPTLLSALDGEVKWDSEDYREKLAAIASRAVDLLNVGGGGALEGKIISPGIAAGLGQPLNLRSLQQRITLSNLLGSTTPKGDVFLPGPCWAGDAQDSLARLVELLDLHYDALRNANLARWEAGRAGMLCTNLGVGSQIRLLDELVKFVKLRDNFDANAATPQEIYEKISPLMVNWFEFVKSASDEDFKKNFKVVLGSTGYHHYFFNIFKMIEGNVHGFLPEGYKDYRQMTSDELAENADRQVKWVQSVVPDFIKRCLLDRLGDEWFELAVPKDVQKACQAKRIDDESDEKMPVEGYLEWINYVKLSQVKEIREDVKSVLSIRLNNDAKGKHFYASWFDSINRIRRISAHPSGRVYKEEDIDTLLLVVDHLDNYLPDSYSRLS